MGVASLQIEDEGVVEVAAGHIHGVEVSWDVADDDLRMNNPESLDRFHRCSMTKYPPMIRGAINRTMEIANQNLM